jgi:recombinational DNA repair protein RecR
MHPRNLGALDKMTSLKKCPTCKTYTIKDKCKKCNTETKSAHYKFIQIKNAPSRSTPFKRR